MNLLINIHWNVDIQINTVINENNIQDFILTDTESDPTNKMSRPMFKGQISQRN